MSDLREWAPQAADSALIEAALAGARLERGEVERLYEITEACNALLCEGDFDSPEGAISHPPPLGCPGACGAYCKAKIALNRPPMG